MAESIALVALSSAPDMALLASDEAESTADEAESIALETASLADIEAEVIMLPAESVAEETMFPAESVAEVIMPPMPPAPKMVVEPVVVVMVEPSVVTTPVRADVVMADEVPLPIPPAPPAPPLLESVEEAIDAELVMEPDIEPEPDMEELPPLPPASASDSGMLVDVSRFQCHAVQLTCAVLSAVLDGGLSILVVGAGLVGAVTDTASEVGVVAVARGVTSLTAREATRNGEHVAGEDVSIARISDV